MQDRHVISQSVTIVVMLIGAFFSWWYGAGWIQVVGSLKRRLAAVADAFSVLQLLRTLFAPWRRIITYPGASLGEKFRAWGDNVVSRVIGFFVRIFVLIGAVLTTLVVGALTVAEIILWPLLPIAIPILLIRGVLG